MNETDKTPTAKQPLDMMFAEQGARLMAFNDMIVARVEKLEATVTELIDPTATPVSSQCKQCLHAIETADPLFCNVDSPVGTVCLDYLPPQEEEEATVAELTPSDIEPCEPEFTVGDRVNTADGLGTVSGVSEDFTGVSVLLDSELHNLGHVFRSADVSPEKTTGLTWKEAEAWMDRGEKVRRPCFTNGSYSMILEGVVCNCGINPSGIRYVFQVCDTRKGDTNTDWEVMT